MEVYYSINLFSRCVNLTQNGLPSMACLIERRVVNPRYKKIAPDNHYFLYNDVDGKYPKKDYYINVDCGRCINCFRKYMSAWRFRLLHEFLSYSHEQLEHSYYVTLTIEPKFYTEHKPALKKMVRRFLERVRKKYKHSIRHFLVTERGEDKNRLHFHGFFFDTDVDPTDLYNLWYYGFVNVQKVVDKEHPISQKVSYCTSYVTKGKKGKLDFIFAPENYPLVLVSPGIGASYSNRYRSQHHGSSLFPMTWDIDGKLRSLPRYLRQKVFSESELKMLKDDYFDNISDDVIPDPPYFIGNKSYDDYTVYLKDLIQIKKQYYLIYGK